MFIFEGSSSFINRKKNNVSPFCKKIYNVEQSEQNKNHILHVTTFNIPKQYQVLVSPGCLSLLNLSLLWAGWVWQAPAAVLHQCWRLPAVLQCGKSLLVPECEGEVGAWDPPALPEGTDTAGRHSGWPPARCQSAHPAGPVQGEAGRPRGGLCVCWGSAGCLVHGVFSAHPEEPKGGVWHCYSGQHPVLRQPATEKAEEADAR